MSTIDKVRIQMAFEYNIEIQMAAIRQICYAKVVADRGQDYNAEDFKLSKFVVTKRQVADSLDALPTSIRSTMVAAAQSFFNAVHEP